MASAKKTAVTIATILTCFAAGAQAGMVNEGDKPATATSSKSEDPTALSECNLRAQMVRRLPAIPLLQSPLKIITWPSWIPLRSPTSNRPHRVLSKRRPTMFTKTHNGKKLSPT